MMTIALISGGVLLLLGVLWFGASLWAARHIAKVAPGAPTPEEAKIIVETKKTAGEIAAEGERKIQEVIGADKDATLDLARKSLWKRSVRKP